ncbi:MAG: hypothetical protein HY537_16240 [Deltaproteobacteria bacterium]|nr:hypothetical protein [Deltaproteobacteria bacterium]
MNMGRKTTYLTDFILGLFILLFITLVVRKVGSLGEAGSVGARHWIVYVVFPLLGATALLLSFATKQRIRIWLACGLIGFMAIGYALDLSLLIIKWRAGTQLPKDKQRLLAAAKKAGQIIDTRTPLELLDDLRNKGQQIVPLVTPGTILRMRNQPLVADAKVMPLAGLSSVRTILCNESGQYIFFESDEHGFNNPRGIHSAAGPFDIAVIGDSFAMGVCVPPEKTIAAYLRAFYPKTINLGYADAGPLLYLATLKEYGLPLKPKVVVMFYYSGNDFEASYRELSYPILAHYLMPTFSQGLRHKQSIVNSFLTEIEHAEEQRARANRVEANKPWLTSGSEWRRLASLSHLRESVGLDHRGDSLAPEVFLRSLKQVLVEMKRTVESWRGSLIFVYLPHYGELEDYNLNRGERNSILGLANEVGIKAIDAHALFSQQTNPFKIFPYGLPSHYNEMGYSVLSEAIREQVVSSR